MILTQGQEAGLRMALKLKTYEDEPRIAVLAGYAGTGKTTLLRRIAQEMGVPMIVAPTGKAALRVQEATGLPASTIHSWMYTPEEDDYTGEVKFHMKPPHDIQRGEVPTLVIDEASMVGLELWEDIFEALVICRMNVLIVGDPFQLPPVQQSKDDKSRVSQSLEFNLLSDHFVCDERVLLTEIVRQAQENPIIRASMMVREGDPASAVFKLPRVSSKDLVERASKAMPDGVVICHTNATRNKLNIAVRGALGKPYGIMVPGEPLLVLQNSYRMMRFNGEVTKFEQWVDAPGGKHKVIDGYRKLSGETRFGIAKLEESRTPDTKQEADLRDLAIIAEEQIFGRMEEYSFSAITKASRIAQGLRKRGLDELIDMSKEERQKALGYPLLHANFGYVMTCHKSQGSEWPHVLVVLEPSLRLGKEDGRRWLYTAVTRARETVTLCMGTGT